MTYASCEDKTSSPVNENATHSDNDKERNEPSETLVLGFTESRSIHKMQDKIIDTAPTQ